MAPRLAQEIYNFPTTYVAQSAHEIEGADNIRRAKSVAYGLDW